jgi:hypothetical protein
VSACLSELTLDRLRVGELAGNAGDEPRRHLAACRACEGRLAAQAREPLPPLDLEAVLRRAARAASSGAVWLRRAAAFGAGAATVAGAALLLVAIPRPAPDTRAKGDGWALAVIARHPSGAVEQIEDGATLAPGTRLRFEVAAPRAGYVALVSLDARGVVSPLVPSAGAAAALPARERRLLEGAVAFDDAPGRERIVYVDCARPVEVSEIVASARRALDAAGGDLTRVRSVSAGCDERSFWVRKAGGAP